MSKAFYITTTLPYVNAPLHVGFAMELIRADAIARFRSIVGDEVYFNTGTDEHGQKIFESAQKEGKTAQAYVDSYFSSFKDTLALLNISENIHVIRTTDEHHQKAAQELWRCCRDAGFIYKGKYQAKYCVGCELEKTDSELDENGQCPIHPGKPLELIDEENYFFALSKVAPLLEKLYAENPNLIVPAFRFNEMKALLERGLQDFSISRVVEKMSWGVPVPDDASQVMYVWFDALTNYISTLGWPEDTDTFEKYWKNGTPVQFCGKDNVRQQSIMWQGMLLAADLPTTNHIVINGFINSGGQKMSKSLGNVIAPIDIISLFDPLAGVLATDVLRYYLLRHGNSFEDFDMTIESVREAYQAHLANGLGNLVSRIMTLSEAHCAPYEGLPNTDIDPKITTAMEGFEPQKAMDLIWQQVQFLDMKIQETRPFTVVKTDVEAGAAIISELVADLYKIAISLEPFMPATSETILNTIRENKKPSVPLFNRLP